MADDVNVRFGADTSGLDAGASRAVNDIDRVRAAVHGIGASAGLVRANMMNLRAQMIDIAQGIPLMLTSPTYGFLNLGNQIAQVSQITGGFGSALALVAQQAARAVVAFAPLWLPIAAAAGALKLMQNEINRSQSVQVSYMDVIVGTFRTIKNGISNLLAPAVQGIEPIFTTVWNTVVGTTLWLGNRIIGVFVATFNNISFVWKNLPNVVGAVVVGTANAVVAMIEWMVNQAIGLLNKLIQFANKVPGVKLGEMKEVDAGRFKNPYADELAKQPGYAQFKKDLEFNYLGEFFEEIKKNSIAKALEPSKKDLERWAKEFKGIIGDVTKQIANIKADTAALTMGHEQALQYAKAQSMIADAVAKGIPLTKQQIAQINQTAAAWARATVEFEHAKAVQDSLKDLAQGITDAFMKFDGSLASLGRAFLQLAAQIAIAVIQALILNAVLSAMGLALPTTGLGAVFAPLFKGFGGGKAAGGPLEPGKWYIAGEHGPEPIWGGGPGAFASGYGTGMDGAYNGPTAKEIAREIAKAVMPQATMGMTATRHVGRQIGELQRRLGGRM